MPNLPLPMAGAIQDRLVLLLNHLLCREPEARDRLRPLAGQALTVTLDGQPPWALQLPALHLGITRAGMFERIDAPAPQAQLCIAIDGSSPLQMAMAALRGERRGVTVRGEAATASAVNWLFENLRWDLGDELQRLVGAAPARALEQAAHGLRAALRGFLAPRGTHA